MSLPSHSHSHPHSDDSLIEKYHSLSERLSQLEEQVLALSDSETRNHYYYPKSMDEYIRTRSHETTSASVRDMGVIAVRDGHLIRHTDTSVQRHGSDEVKRVGSLLYIDRDTVLNLLYPIEIIPNGFEGELKLINGDTIYMSGNGYDIACDILKQY